MKRSLIIVGVVIVAVGVTLGLGWLYHKISREGSLPLGGLAQGVAKTPQEALSRWKNGDFAQLPSPRLSVGLTHQIHWVHFEVRTDLVPADWVLEVPNVRVHELELYRLSSSGLVSLGRTGARLPFEQRPILTRTFGFPIHLNAYERAHFFLKIDKRHEDLSTELSLWTASRFEQLNQREYLLWGVFLGFGILLLSVNFIFWRLTQDSNYVWYSIYTLTFGLRQFTDVGLSFQYLWPNLPQLNEPDPVIQTLWLYLPAFITFSIHFLQLNRADNRSYVVLVFLRNLFLTMFGALVIAQCMGLPEQYPGLSMWVFRIHALLSTPVIFINFWSAIEQASKRSMVVFLYTCAIIFQLVAQLFILYQNLGRNEPGASTLVPSYVLLMAVFVVDVIIFSFALGLRFSQSLFQNESLQVSLLDTQAAQQQQLIEALEGERQRIVQDLEYDVGGLLDAAQRNLDELPEPIKQAAATTIQGAKRLIDKSHADLKKVSLNLLPIDFADIGLAGALAEVVEQVNASEKIRIRFEQVGEYRGLSVATEVQLYRIANELINNVLKHAEATQALVRLEFSAAWLRLRVQDNGKGFAAAPASQGGIGVQNLYSRAEHLRAQVQLDSGPQGTTIDVQVPLAVD